MFTFSRRFGRYILLLTKTMMLYTMENTKNQGIVSMEFSFPDLKKHFFVSVLALSDTLFLIIQLITLGLLESVNEYEFSKSVQFGRPVILPIRNFAYICSIYFIVLLTIERFIVICHQHKVQDISTLDILTSSFNSMLFIPKLQPQTFQP